MLIMRPPRSPQYLEPYASAARQHGPGFKALLWASRATQAQRFDALAKLCNLTGKSVLDVGCGHADLAGYLIEHRIEYAEYRGLEAMDDFATAAEKKDYPRCTIARGDFVTEPVKMFVAADVVVFSGSLNTLDQETFYATLRRAFDATAHQLIFNYLDSPYLANARFLTWHRPDMVLAFARGLTPDVNELSNYMEGDRTLLLEKA